MKKFRDFSDLNERVVNIAQRKKQARRMAVLAKSSAFQAKKKRSLMKVRNSQKLLLVAKKQLAKYFTISAVVGPVLILGTFGNAFVNILFTLVVAGLGPPIIILF